ncbi:hypothetical protein MO973_20780 [Paenibacillus sp. TRM 82003]|nr:hypothetical protein [Paenibacillus sp. TRM 82003]
MERHFEELDLCFDPLPYEETYLMIRREYIDLLDNWKDTLNKTTSNFENVVDDHWEEIDELIDEHSDFVHTEGDDGPYAWEIYKYTRKLRELQRQVLAWRPARKLLYWVTGSGSNSGYLNEHQTEVYDNICTDLYVKGYEDFIHYVIKHHQHPYHWGLNYVFDDEVMANEAYAILKPFCDNHGVELTIVEAYKCEAHCGDVLEAEADTYINGFFYCYSCKESQDRGVFTLQELEAELKYYEDNERDRQDMIDERGDWIPPLKWKIKRSCRTYEIEVPAWAE